MHSIKKVLILGSGALKIGQAGEFDYSGSQAIKALKEEGILTVLINPNIATIQTSRFLADTVYYLPIDEFFIEKIIAKEKPDGILISFGGQTALNCGMNLYKKGILKKYDVKILGTPIKSVIISENRNQFARHVKKIGLQIPPSETTRSATDAETIAKKIGYPVMVRAGFALGGQKSGVAYNTKDLQQIVSTALAFSDHVLIEKYLHHYKEIEYEIVRDQFDNCVAVCNMENVDPLGIHTGDSIVVAPSQTLTNFEYHFLREKAIELVRSLNIIGECNVQYALNPHPQNSEIEYYVIELNPRLSRSSALASKATGYPLAYVGAQLILGKSLTEVQNQVTKTTQSCFEPALDYIVVKIPRWDLNKFKQVHQKLGSSMKSVGEIMAIGRTFEEALQKGLRMLDIGIDGLTDNHNSNSSLDELKVQIKNAHPLRIFSIAEGMKRAISTDELYALSGIDPWFLERLKHIITLENELLQSKKLTKETLLKLKQSGCSDKKIGSYVYKSELEIRILRKEWQITPSIFQIDTLAGEFPAQTNYVYLTYHGSHHDIKPLGRQGVIVLGSGPYRIGSSVEFDWTCVNTVMYLKSYNKKSIVINCNPETVSTDYDMSDRLYFEQLTFETIADIYEFENSEGIIVSVGGQHPNTLAKPLNEHGCVLLGTTAKNIDIAEDRNKFSSLLDSEHIGQPDWNTFTNLKEAVAFAKRVQYPVLIRPSYVLSGSAMNICYNDSDLEKYINEATIVSNEHPITISKFFTNAKEIELDGVAQKGIIQISAVSEHVEEAGVHSGDASIIYPSQNVNVYTEHKIMEIAQILIRKLEISGPFNIQFLAKDNLVSVIEMNVRASRTLPFISKATGVNFARIIVDSIFQSSQPTPIFYPSYVAVKVPEFSFSRLEGADPISSVEMASTGESASFGATVEEAFLKAIMSVGISPPKRGIFLSLGGDENKIKFFNAIWRLNKCSLPIYATEKTALFLKKNGIKTKKIFKIHDKKNPNTLDLFQTKKVDLAIIIVDHSHKKDIDDDYIIRRSAVDHNIPLLTNRKKAELFIKAITSCSLEDLEAQSWQEYVRKHRSDYE